MPPTHYPAYRAYLLGKRSLDDALEVLLFASRYTVWELDQRDPDDRERYLPDLYPQITDVNRTHRRVASAVTLLGGAESHLAFMGIPYAVANYESFVTGTLAMLRSGGMAIPNKVRLSAAHGLLLAVGVNLPPLYVEIFDFCRRLRNRIVHAGGMTGGLKSAYPRGQARAIWEKWTKRQLPFGSSNDRLELLPQELRAVHACTHRLAVALNSSVPPLISGAAWAQIIAADFLRLYPRRFRAPKGEQHVVGFARLMYPDARTTVRDLQAAARSLRAS
jgi:hypothetical protein